MRRTAPPRRSSCWSTAATPCCSSRPERCRPPGAARLLTWWPRVRPGSWAPQRRSIVTASGPPIGNSSTHDSDARPRRRACGAGNPMPPWCARRCSATARSRRDAPWGPGCATVRARGWWARPWRRRSAAGPPPSRPMASGPTRRPVDAPRPPTCPTRRPRPIPAGGPVRSQRGCSCGACPDGRWRCGWPRSSCSPAGHPYAGAKERSRRWSPPRSCCGGSRRTWRWAPGPHR